MTYLNTSVKPDGGTGWLGDVGEEWGDACGECTERGVDPLNINLKLLEGGVSPTAGVNLFDPTRPPCTLRDVLTLKDRERRFM